MNAKQVSSIRRATNLLSQLYTTARLSFRVEELPGGSMLFSASTADSDLRWFEKHYNFFAIVGPRGGIRKYEGNMSL